jgi:hypothetical protein
MTGKQIFSPTIISSKQAGLSNCLSFLLVFGLLASPVSLAKGQVQISAQNKTAPEKQEKKPAEAATQEKPKPQIDLKPILDSAVTVIPEDLVSKPNDYLNKNVKFLANFAGFSSLALDYKPAMRSSKTHLSFLIFRPQSKVPLSELKLAMAMPKEKDPENALLATLKEGDQLELVGKVFSTALDDPWVEVFQLKRLGEEKKAQSTDDKEAKATGDAESKSESKTDTKSDSKTDSKESKPESKSKSQPNKSIQPETKNHPPDVIMKMPKSGKGAAPRQPAKAPAGKTQKK